MDEQDETPSEMLRSWARGSNPLSAGTELLIRSGFAQSWRPWVRWDESSLSYWIAFAVIPELIGGMSGGEKRILMIASSLAADTPIVLNDEIPGLDRDRLQLVLAALAHAAGFHEPGRTIEIVDERPQMVRTSALYSWPE